MFQLDSATSLIQAAKNLMNAVVLTVKSSYVASTKYPRQNQVAVSNKPQYLHTLKILVSPVNFLNKYLDPYKNHGDFSFSLFVPRFGLQLQLKERKKKNLNGLSAFDKIW